MMHTYKVHIDRSKVEAVMDAAIAEATGKFDDDEDFKMFVKQRMMEEVRRQLRQAD